MQFKLWNKNFYKIEVKCIVLVSDVTVLRQELSANNYRNNTTVVRDIDK